MASNLHQHNQLLQLFAAYAKRLDKLYDDFVTRLIATLPLSEDEVWQKLADNPLFLFDDLPYMKARLQHIFDDYVNKQVLCYKAGITDGVALAFSQDKINLGKYTILQDEAIKAARNAAVASFIKNRMSRAEGMSLSDKVWNYSQLGKSEVEMGISNVIKDGLKAGTSAEELGRKVRQYLNNPTMMYRRYWVNVATAGGGKKKVARWYRRHIDEKTGKVTFKDEPLERVGTGVYRSARMNGYRLMRTEINMSYHKANASRWAQEPFVYGIRIWLSPQHPKPDICDELVGEYPKDFIFSGFHPNCLCASAPLTLWGDEKRDFYRRLMKGEDMSNFHSKYEITEKNMNPNWKRYIEQQHGAILKAGERGKLAYHLQDNQKYWVGQFSPAERKQMGLEPKKLTVKEIAAQRHAARTPEQAKEIADRWHEHKRVDTLVREANKLIPDLKEYPLAANWKVLQGAVNDRNAHTLEKLLGDKMILKKLAYEKLITPEELKWSNFKRVFGDDAYFWQKILDNSIAMSQKQKTLSESLHSLHLNMLPAKRGFNKEQRAFWDSLITREERRMRDFFNFNRYKGELQTGLDYLKKNIAIIGSDAVKVPDIDIASFFLDDVSHMKTLSGNIKVMGSNLEALVDNASFVVNSKSPIIRQLYEGIRYKIQKDGLMTNVDDLIDKLNTNIYRLQKEAAKRKVAKARQTNFRSIAEIEKSLNTRIDGTKQGNGTRLAYYNRLAKEIEKELTFYKAEYLPNALQSRRNKLFGAIDAGVSDGRLRLYFEQYKHGLAVQQAWDEQWAAGYRSALSTINNSLAANNIKSNPVSYLTSIDQGKIIAKISGGDQTEGSCSSLAFTYAANKNGFDVRDFRGGASREFFSKNNNISRIISRCRGTVIRDYDDYKGAMKALKLVEEGKEYYFASGRHAAIIRKAENGYEFLELQSPYRNGFEPLTKEKLKKRFDCKHQHTTSGFKYKGSTELIDINRLGMDKDFKKMMEYINTAKDAQKKGINGGIK